MKRLQALAYSAVALAGLAGCQTGGQAYVEGAGAAGPVATSVDDYRKIRFAEAMRGLVVADGRVSVDRQAAKGVELIGAGDALAAGRSLMDENDFSGAAGEFRRAILADERLAPAYEGLGDALVCKKKDDMALAAYSTAAGLAPGDTLIGMKLAETINRNGDLEGWAAALERVLEIDPDHGEAHARLAVARFYMGDRDGAREQATLAERHGGIVPPQLKAMLTN